MHQLQTIPHRTPTDADLQKVKPDPFTCTFTCLTPKSLHEVTGCLWAWPMIPSDSRVMQQSLPISWCTNPFIFHVRKNLGYCWWALLQQTAGGLLTSGLKKPYETRHLKQTIWLIIQNLLFTIKTSECMKSRTSACPQTSFSGLGFQNINLTCLQTLPRTKPPFWQLYF